MISPLPGATPTVPGSATRPLPGIVPEIVTKDGQPCPTNHGGFLVIKQPWPSMLRTLYGDDERYKIDILERHPGCYFTGDGARRDENGNYWIMGRVDDVLERRRPPSLDHGSRERPGQSSPTWPKPPSWASPTT